MPIESFQEKLDEIYKEQMRIYRIKIVIYEEKLNALKKDLRRCVSKDKSTDDIESKIEDLLEDFPEHPRHVHLIYSDTTSEALIDGMSHGNKYAAIASGEGGVVLRSAVMNDYPLLNGFWGGETGRKKRKAARSSIVVGGRLTISLDVQPEVFFDFMQKKGEVMHASGFLARSFITWPSSMIGHRYFEKPDNPDANYEGYEEKNKEEVHYKEYVRRLKSYLEKLPGILSGDEPRVVIKLDKSADKKMESIANAIEFESNPGGMFHGHEGYASKLAEKILRLACLLNVFEYGVDSDITEGAVDHALHLGMYYAGQHLEIFKYKSSEEKDDELLLEWVSKKRHQGIRYIKKNYIRQHVCPIDLRNAKRLNPALERLEQLGEVKRYMSYRTECVDLMPGYLVDSVMAMSLGGAVPLEGSGRVY